MTEYKCLCPAYNIGMCDVYSGRRHQCTYPDEAHVPCDDNHLCNDMDCKLGHSISKNKRKMIITIYNKYNNGNNPKDCCTHHYNCINRYCEYKHTIDNFNMRKTICNIIRSENEEDAEWYYDTFYVNKHRINNGTKNIKTHAQPMFKKTESELSEASTEETYKKVPKSPVSSYEMMGMKNIIEDDAIVHMEEKENVLEMLSMVVPSMKGSIDKAEDTIEKDNDSDIVVTEVVSYSVKKEELDELKNELIAFKKLGTSLLEKIEKLEKNM